MPQQQANTIQNNFTGGLKTEFTGLNFPENAATDTVNCIYSIIGEVFLREGIDLETGYVTRNIDKTNKAVSSFKWTNAGGDGTSEIYVLQVGSNVFFYRTSDLSGGGSLSSKIMGFTLDLTVFQSEALTTFFECEYAMGNGYLFIFHPDMNPVYCSYDGTNISARYITLQVRAFNGVPEPGVTVNN